MQFQNRYNVGSLILHSLLQWKFFKLNIVGGQDDHCGIAGHITEEKLTEQNQKIGGELEESITLFRFTEIGSSQELCPGNLSKGEGYDRKVMGSGAA